MIQQIEIADDQPAHPRPEGYQSTLTEFCLPHHEQLARPVDIADAQSRDFPDAHSRAIEQLRNPVQRLQVCYQPAGRGKIQSRFVETLLRWYRSGVDPGSRLFQLSTFLGHVNPASTAVYLTVTTDLLSEANQRFERWAAPLIQEVLS